MRLRGLFVLAFASTLSWIDLAVKASVHTEPWSFHHRSHMWAALSIALLPMVVALAAFPSWRVAASAGMLAGGGLGNLLSALGDGMRVPDPFVAGRLAFNVADTFVLVGITGLMLSFGLLAVRYRQHLLPPRRWERAVFERVREQRYLSG